MALAGLTLAACQRSKEVPSYGAPAEKKTLPKPEVEQPVSASGSMPSSHQPEVVDLRFLNDEHGPAGSHGRLLRQGDELRFEDGTPARFFGVNLTAYALFGSSNEVIRSTSERLSRLGINLVRIHHHDSHWVKPNIFTKGTSTRKLNPSSLERIGRWVFELRRRGIYTWLDLEVGRRYLPGDDIEAVDELEEGDARGFSHVSPLLKERSREFTQNYLSFENPHTGVSLGGDPGVVFALVSNENDLATHYGNRMLAAAKRPVYTRLFEKAAEPIIERYKLKKERALRLWEPGEGKVLQAHLENQWAKSEVAYARKFLPHALIVPTSTWGYSPLWALEGLRPGDFVDVHSYGEAELLRRDPRKEPNLVAWMGAAALEGYPVTVSEWNVPPPAADRFVAPTYVASVAALQGWDAILLYAYGQYPPGAPRRKPNQWSAMEDPALLEQIPAAALLFRRADVSEARRTIVLAPSAKDVFGKSTSPRSSRTLRTAVEQSRIAIRLPDMGGANGTGETTGSAERVVTDMNQDLLLPGAHTVESDTQELRRDYEAGRFFINTARTQGATGRLGGERLKLGAIELELSTKEAAVIVSSLDGLPIASSQHLLVSATGTAQVKNEELPYLRERVQGQLSITTPHAHFHVQRLGESESEGAPVERAASQGKLKLQLNGGGFILLIAEDPPLPGQKEALESGALDSKEKAPQPN